MTTDIPRLAARRTPEVERVLQQLWTLRPDLIGQHKLTIFLSLEAFVRESATSTEPSFAIADETGAESKPSEHIPVLETVASSLAQSEESDDVEWD